MAILAERLADGMKWAWEAPRREPITSNEAGWSVEPVALPPAQKLELMQTRIMESLKATNRTPGEENLLTNNMSKIPWLQRSEAGKRIDVGCLTLGRARILFMPGELSVEYQLAAKVAGVEPEVESVLMSAISKLLHGKP